MKNKILNTLYNLSNPSFYGYLNYKISNFFYFNKNLRIFYYIYWPIWRIISVLLGIEIYGKTKIGRGLKIVHYGGIFINPNSLIGENCIIYNNVTIGGKEYNGRPKCPRIGNNVKIGVGAKILGDIVIGNNVNIGANSVVVKSFPNDCIIGGVPANIIKK